MNKTVIAIKLAAVAVFVALLAIAVFATKRDQRQEDINRAVCISVVRLDNAITDSLRRSLVALPKIAYFRQHPDELAAQRADIRRSLKKFVPPKECVGSIITRR